MIKPKIVNVALNPLRETIVIYAPNHRDGALAMVNIDFDWKEIVLSDDVRIVSSHRQTIMNEIKND